MTETRWKQRIKLLTWPRLSHHCLARVIVETERLWIRGALDEWAIERNVYVLRKLVNGPVRKGGYRSPDFQRQG